MKAIMHAEHFVEGVDATVAFVENCLMTDFPYPINVN